MRLKIRTNNDTIVESGRTVAIMPGIIDPDIVSRCIIHNHNRYYWIVAVNNIDYWHYGDYIGLFSMMYKVHTCD